MIFDKNVPIDIPMQDFLSEIIRLEETDGSRDHSLSLGLFKTLYSMGCSYFELLSIYAFSGTFTPEDLSVFVSLMPSSTKHLTISTKNIRQCISRWTASRYHTAPIDQVVNVIKEMLLEGNPGITTFNSNLNLKNRKAVNDRYILLIFSSEEFFIDINRRLIYKFFAS